MSRRSKLSVRGLILGSVMVFATLAAVGGIIINDGEARQLTGEINLIDAAHAIREFGPRFVVIKKGEHGALLATADEITVIPARPTADVRDPTGAGDSFAGGMLGYLAAEGRYDSDPGVAANVARLSLMQRTCVGWMPTALGSARCTSRTTRSTI